MDTNIKMHIDAIKKVNDYLQEQLDLANKTILNLSNQIANLQKDRFCADERIKAAYKDGYGTAIQRVLNLIKEIDKEDTYEYFSRE